MSPDRCLKICGITRTVDALTAAEHGATAIGFVFWEGSSRFIDPLSARQIVEQLPANVTPVGVFVNESIDGIRRVVERAGIRAVQLHGDEPATYSEALDYPLFRSVTLAEARAVADRWPPAVTLLLDAADPVKRGGTGQAVDWSRAADLARERPLILAGGLTAVNVAEAIDRVRPFGVDVSSGVERSPGVKDADKVRCFLANARAAYAHGEKTW